MKLQVRRLPDHKTEEVTGKEARALLKQVLTKIGQDILIPVPPHTGVVRRRAIERLKSGGTIWDESDHNGQPTGTIITMPLKIVGIIKKDGTYEKVGEDDHGT